MISKYAVYDIVYDIEYNYCDTISYYDIVYEYTISYYDIVYDIVLK